MPVKEIKQYAGRVKVKKITDPRLVSKLVEKHTGLINLKYQNELINDGNTHMRKRKYAGKTRKNLHRDLIGFARTKRHARYELLKGGAGSAPSMATKESKKPERLIDADVTTKERVQSITRSIAQTTGVSKVGNILRSATGRVGAFFDFNNPEASQIVEVEIAGRNFINTALAYKAYLLKMREALMVIDKKILTPIIVGSIKGKKGGELFNDDSANSMVNKSTMKYLYRLANLRDNTYIDYIGKCSLSSLEGTKTRLKLVVDWFKKASGNLQPIDRYSGMRYRFFMCKLYKLREAELEFNFRLQQLTQSLKFISNLPAYQTLQEFIKIDRTEYNTIEYLDIKKTKTAFTNYETQIMKDIQSQKINTEAVDFQDSVLSKSYYKTLQTVPANIERVKWTVNKCMVIAYEIDSLQDEIFRSTGFAPNRELNFVLRTGATKRLKDNATRMAYFDRVNSINLRIDNYVQYLLQSLDSAINYGNEENHKGTTYQEIADMRDILSFLNKELNKISTYQSADVQKVQERIRYFLNAGMEKKIMSSKVTPSYFPSTAENMMNSSNTLTNIITKVSGSIAKENKKNLFDKNGNKGVLYNIYADDTSLTQKLWSDNVVMTRTELQQIIGAMQKHYAAKLQNEMGDKPFDMQSQESVSQLGKDLSKMNLDLRRAPTVQKGGAEFSSEPNESYPASMTILPFGYPDDVLTASKRINQSCSQIGGGFDVSRDEKVQVYSTVIDSSNPASQRETNVQFNVIRISETSLKGFYRDLMFILNNPMFFESRGFFQKLGDFFTRATKTQKTKEIHRIYMNYIVKFEMGVLNFDDTTPDGKTPSRFPTGTAFSGYPSFVMMKLYWQYLDLTRYTNYSDLAYLDLQKLIKVRADKKFMKMPAKYKYSKKDAGYENMKGVFGNAALSNYGSDYAGIPPSFLQIGLLNQDEVKAILSEDSMEAIKDIFKSAVYKLVNERINKIRQDDIFIKQMHEAGDKYLIRMLKPQVLDILDKWGKAITDNDITTIKNEVTKLLDYVTAYEKTKLENYLTTITTPLDTTTLSDYLTDPLVNESGNPSKFTEDAVNDYGKDFTSIIKSYTGGFRILYYLSATMSGKKYKYYDPDVLINDYRQGVPIPELSNIPGSTDRRTEFNSYKDDKQQLLMGMIRAKFSMLRGADYNDTYFPIKEDGQIDRDYLSDNKLVVKTDTDSKSQLAIGEKYDWKKKTRLAFRAIFIELPKMAFKLGFSLLHLGTITLLLPLLVPLCLYLYDNPPTKKPAAGTTTTSTLSTGTAITVTKAEPIAERNINESLWDKIVEKIKSIASYIKNAEIWDKIKNNPEIVAGGTITAIVSGCFALLGAAFLGIPVIIGLIILLCYGINKLLANKSKDSLFRKLLNLGELLKDKTPEEQKREFDVNSTVGEFHDWITSELLTDTWDEFIYRDYTLDKAEFAMANMYMYEPLAAHPKPTTLSSTPPRYTDYNSVLGDMICKYLSIYYKNDPNLPEFKKFIEKLNTAKQALAADPLLDSPDSTLHILVRNLIGETDKHSKDVFEKFIASASASGTKWEEKYKLAAIYMKDDGGGGTSRLKMIDISDSKLIKIFGKSSSGKLQIDAYYGEPGGTAKDGREDAQLSLLMQVLKLSGCVRLICCLHVVYKQFSNLEKKVQQMAQANKGVSKDLKTDAVDELYSRIADNAYSPGNFRDLKLFMDACGIKIIQYYRTRITDLISRERIELTGQTQRPKVQEVFNNTLTKLLMFLRLNLIYTDYIQFKKRFITKPTNVVDTTNSLKDWDDVLDLGDSTSTSGITPIEYIYVVFNDVDTIPSGATEIKINSIYPTFDTIITLDPKAKALEYLKFSINISNIVYYSVDNTIYSQTQKSIVSAKLADVNVIVCNSASAADTKYIIFIKNMHKTITSKPQPKYALSSPPGNRIVKFFSDKDTNIVLEPLVTKLSLKPGGTLDFDISPDAETLDYIHPLYPSKPTEVTPDKLIGTSTTPVYYYPSNGVLGNTDTHKHLDTNQPYYVTTFPTFTKMSTLVPTDPTTPIILPIKVDLEEYKTKLNKWTFSDFVWVPSTGPGIKLVGGRGQIGGISQVGGSGFTCNDADKNDNKCKAIACYLRDNINKVDNRPALNEVSANINNIIKYKSDAIEATKDTGHQETVSKLGQEKQYKIISFYYLYEYFVNYIKDKETNTDDCKTLKRIANQIINFSYSKGKGEQKMQNSAESGKTELASDLTVATINNMISNKTITDFPIPNRSNQTNYDYEETYKKILALSCEKPQLQTTTQPTAPQGNENGNGTGNTTTTEDKPNEAEVMLRRIVGEELQKKFTALGLSDLQSTLQEIKTKLDTKADKADITELGKKLEKLVTDAIATALQGKSLVAGDITDACLQVINTYVGSADQLIARIAAVVKIPAPQVVTDATTELNAAKAELVKSTTDLQQAKAEFIKAGDANKAEFKTLSDSVAALVTSFDDKLNSAVQAGVAAEFARVQQGQQNQSGSNAPDMGKFAKEFAEAIKTVIGEIKPIIDAASVKTGTATATATATAPATVVTIPDTSAQLAALKDSIDKLTKEKEKLEKETYVIDKIIAIEKENKDKIVQITDNYAKELKATTTTFMKELKDFQTIAKNERTATNTANRNERQAMRDDFKQIIADLTTKLIGAEKLQSTAVVSGAVSSDIAALTAQVATLTGSLTTGLAMLQNSLPKSETVDIASDVSALKTAASGGDNAEMMGVLKEILTHLKGPVAATGSSTGSSTVSATGSSTVPSAVSSTIGIGVLTLEADDKTKEEAEAKAKAAAALPGTEIAAAVTTATIVSTGAAKSEYNFSSIQKLPTTPGLQINIITTAKDLFAQIDELITAAKTTAATATPAPDNYYFVIGNEIAVKPPGTKPVIEYVFTNVIDLTQYLNIKCIYAISGGDAKLPTAPTINFMQVDKTNTNLKTIIETYKPSGDTPSYIKPK